MFIIYIYRVIRLTWDAHYFRKHKYFWKYKSYIINLIFLRLVGLFQFVKNKNKISDKLIIIYSHKYLKFRWLKFSSGPAFYKKL